MEAKFTVAGLRGVWGDNLNTEIVEKHIRAFGHFLQKRNAKRIIIGRDARSSGPSISTLTTEILTKAGIDVTDIGLAPTPTVLFLVRSEKYDGGIIITASHNPPEYNGVKFVTSSGGFTTENEVEEIKEYFSLPLHEKTEGTLTRDSDLSEKHIEHILKNVDRDLIASKKFTVVLDPINSAGAILGPKLIESLGCAVAVINGVPDGNFAHIPEPLPENLTRLGEIVKKFNADIGFAQDPDADRLVVCDETGTIVFEEYTLSLAIKAVLKKTPGDIVTNLSTTNTNEDLVQAVGFKNYRTKVGEANVVEGIKKYNAVIGGEGGGGVIYPKINLCRDSLTGIALILESLAQENKKVSEIVSELPKYEFIKTKMAFSGDLQSLIEKTINLFPDGIPDKQDGLRIDFSDRSWVQIRSSNTEPIIRIFAEAKTKDRAESLISQVQSLLTK